MHKSVESITMELILNTFGASLSRDNEGFVITHKDGRQRLPVVGIKSIQISKGAQITSDAVMLAIENEIEIMFMDKSGKPVGRVWSPKYGSISTIRKGQLNFTFTKDALIWIKDIVSKKIENQQALLLMMQTQDIETDSLRKKSISRLEDYLAEINLFYGKHGFSVVQSPKTGTSAELNGLMSQLVNSFIWTFCR